MTSSPHHEPVTLSPLDSASFFLGGRDLEMRAVADLVGRAIRQGADIELHDGRLAWGARASCYSAELAAALRSGRVAVLVELIPDVECLGGQSGTLLLVDHHGDGGPRSTAVEQVFELLGFDRERDWTRELDLIAANDRGYVPAMLELAATREEMVRIRARDRAAQGITEEEEAQADAALADKRELLGGRLTVVGLPHSRTAPVEDRLHVALGGPGVDNLLVLSPGEANFFGDGGVICRLVEQFEASASWCGGDLPHRGYFGLLEPPRDLEAVVEGLLAE